MLYALQAITLKFVQGVSHIQSQANKTKIAFQTFQICKFIVVP